MSRPGSDGPEDDGHGSDRMRESEPRALSQKPRSPPQARNFQRDFRIGLAHAVRCLHTGNMVNECPWLTVQDEPTIRNLNTDEIFGENDFQECTQHLCVGVLPMTA